MKKIIVAEDSAVLRELLGDTLSEAGYTDVQFFQNGKEAWEYLEFICEDNKKDPLELVQLMITDIEMPQMDGHHLTKRVKSHPRLKNIPRSEEHTSELQSRFDLVCRLLLEKKKQIRLTEVQ